jgi:hypothetical protein
VSRQENPPVWANSDFTPVCSGENP